MRLRNVTIKGFKSFADQTVLHFGEDVTGIVGPNGSGKSNIVDAIRWVLGEMKTKELRLEKLNDVIFNGTQKRKRSGVAKVSLTFENTRNLIPTEYHTVTISRLLYQTGESEYRLNDVVCRRKDITNLFMDTGIGSNSYAIIGQGNISQVVEGREGSRRLMIEEAAGISKYKMRKKETISKLASTDADLDRVDDLLYELERNLKDLERQARRAKKYKEVKAKYRETSIDLALLSTEKYRKEYQELKEEIIQGKAYLTKLRKELHTEEAEVEKLKKHHIDLEQTVSSSQRKMNELLDALRQKESAREIKKQRYDFLKGDLQRVKDQVAVAERQLAEDRAALEEADRQLQKVQSQKEEAQKEVEQAERAYSQLKGRHESARADLNDYVKNKQELNKTVFDLEKNIAVNINKAEGHRFRIEKVKGELEHSDKIKKTLGEEVKELGKEKKSLEKQVAELESLLSEREARLKEVVEEKQKITIELSDLKRNRDRTANQRDLIQNMVDNLEGFPDSVRFLSSNWKKGLVLLSDLIDLPDEFRPSVEAYLEPYLNHFVVADYKEAISAIELLGRSQKGRAQFFLLSECGSLDKMDVEVPSKAQSARDLIKADAAYSDLLDHLLGHVYITTSPEELEAYQGSGVLLHMDGSKVRTKAQVKGGSVGLFQGKKLGRKKELEKLNSSLTKLEKEITSLEVKLEKKEAQIKALEEADLTHDLNTKRRLAAEVSQKHVASATRLETIETTVAQQFATLNELESEIHTLESEAGRLKGSLDNNRKALTGLESEIENRGGEVDQWIGKISLASEAQNAAHRRLLTIQGQESTLKQQIDFNNSRYKSNEQVIAEGKMRIKDEGEEMARLQDDITKLEESLLTEYEKRGAIQEQLNEVEKSYFEERKNITAKEELVRELHRRINSHQEAVESKSQRYGEVRLELRSITDRVEVEFGTTLKEIMDSGREVEGSVESLSEEAESLRLRLERFGQINHMALEAFEEMKLRYDDIQTQRKDILEAKESLEATIKEIEEQAVGQFFEAFEKVKVHFKDVFRSLFTEDDDCDLILTDPEDPLNSDIEVIARPKGKRPRILTQLSGGEKAMTAIALLFALYLLKPAPFCIFDEVDAPFDDMNVSKFNNIMRRFAEQSQFIVITHNKLTMARMDVLYGIFMQEPGVSGVSQVDFRSFKDEMIFEAN
jgi:chromosome segregation protein